VHVPDVIDALPKDHPLVRLDDPIFALLHTRVGISRGYNTIFIVAILASIAGGERIMQHRFGNQSGEFADTFVDIIPPPSLNGIMGLSAASAFLVGEFFGGRLNICGSCGSDGCG
jgi:hypothetical protein